MIKKVRPNDLYVNDYKSLYTSLSGLSKEDKYSYFLTVLDYVIDCKDDIVKFTKATVQNKESNDKSSPYFGSALSKKSQFYKENLDKRTEAIKLICYLKLLNIVKYLKLFVILDKVLYTELEDSTHTKKLIDNIKRFLATLGNPSTVVYMNKNLNNEMTPKIEEICRASHNSPAEIITKLKPLASGNYSQFSYDKVIDALGVLAPFPWYTNNLNHIREYLRKNLKEMEDNASKPEKQPSGEDLNQTSLTKENIEKQLDDLVASLKKIPEAPKEMLKLPPFDKEALKVIQKHKWTVIPPEIKEKNPAVYDRLKRANLRKTLIASEGYKKDLVKYRDTLFDVKQNNENILRVLKEFYKNFSGKYPEIFKGLIQNIYKNSNYSSLKGKSKVPTSFDELIELGSKVTKKAARINTKLDLIEKVNSGKLLLDIEGKGFPNSPSNIFIEEIKRQKELNNLGN